MHPWKLLSGIHCIKETSHTQETMPHDDDHRVITILSMCSLQACISGLYIIATILLSVSRVLCEGHMQTFAYGTK